MRYGSGAVKVLRSVETSDSGRYVYYYCDRKKIFHLIKYPKYKPAYQSFTLIGSGLSQSLILMENGWLALIADHVKSEYTIFDLFDQEGKYIANFKMDIPAEGLFFNNGKAYAIATEEGYKFVKRYRIKLQEYKGNNLVDCPMKRILMSSF